MTRIGIVGVGRAGRSIATALTEAGWDVSLVGARESSGVTLDDLALHNDIVLLCVPDSAIVYMVARFDPAALDSTVVVAHCSGATGIDVLQPARRRGSIHPLVSLNGHNPSALRGAYFAVAGDPELDKVVEALSGRIIKVDDGQRSLYHAGAVIASNHLVALMSQVGAIAEQLSVPFDAFMTLAVESLAATSDLGPSAALTGPVSRGDVAVVRTHVTALRDAGLEDEIVPYIAMARRAAVLAGRDPDDFFEAPPEP